MQVRKGAERVTSLLSDWPERRSPLVGTLNLRVSKYQTPILNFKLHFQGKRYEPAGASLGPIR
jgi:hypothetical protein